jgi:hypothetical protein
MKRSYVAVAALAAVLAAPAAHADETIRGYVTQVEVNAASKEIRVWVAPERKMKGSRDLQLDVSDPFVAHILAMARDALARRLPVKVRLSEKRVISSFFLRRYPSRRQLDQK